MKSCVYTNEFKIWEFANAETRRKVRGDLSSEERRPKFEEGEAAAEAAKLKKFSDAGELKFGGCPTPAKTKF